MASSGWPWMQGIEVAIDDPIAPVCPEDDRPSVKVLIEEHAEKIAKIKAALREDPLFDADKHDDLWILRYWLSHKKSKDAIDAAKHTLKFRHEHHLDDKDIRSVAPQHVTMEQNSKIREYLDCWKPDAVLLTHPHPQRGVVTFINFASMDQHVVVERCSEDHWFEIYLYSSEWAFQWLDYVTRTTGRLTKSVRLADLSGLTLGGFNRECGKRDGRAMTLMEDCYPQLLETVFICNGPSLIWAVWKLFSVIVPKRVKSKFDIISPKDNPKDRKKLFRHLTEEDLPEVYGGKYTVGPEIWGLVSDDENGTGSDTAAN
ncbi:expressed unknown protein [Seminavis robusta]|uniref:CRAL-TRIO domain-containing protein n=1 Tax=Seminavis robusta TaxID=568900 RepID=A0A9N8H7K7_9STRA|nr:expressed unknown protein [Seminavis robusta]|eukprot:Sro143_g066511.1  (315) ;mRNA; r:27813-28824